MTAFAKCTVGHLVPHCTEVRIFHIWPKIKTTFQEFCQNDKNLFWDDLNIGK
jgi:hypothetical protein